MFSSHDFIQIADISVLRARSVPGRFSVKPRSIDALAFRLTGNAEFECRGEKFLSRPGDIFFMPKNTPYTVSYTEGEIIVFHFISGESSASAKNFSGAFSERIYNLFVKAELAWKEKNPGFKFLCTSLLYEIIAELCAAKSGESLPIKFASAVSEINNRFSDCELCISEICRNHNISETYLRRLFHRYYGKTPIEYLTELRLKYAENLLLSFYTVEEAASASGFSDSKYFARVFKKKLGRTPSSIAKRK